jgi:hypothetical protein
MDTRIQRQVLNYTLKAETMTSLRLNSENVDLTEMWRCALAMTVLLLASRIPISFL